MWEGGRWPPYLRTKSVLISMENLCMCFTLCYSLFRLWFSLDPEITGLVEEFSSAAKISSFSIVLRFDLFGFGFCFDWACSNLLVNHGPLLAGQIPDRWCRSKLADVVVDRHLQLWVFRLCRCPFLLLWTAPVECPVLPFNFSVPIRFQPSSRRPGLSSPTRPDFPSRFSCPRAARRSAFDFHSRFSSARQSFFDPACPCRLNQFCLPPRVLISVIGFGRRIQIDISIGCSRPDSSSCRFWSRSQYLKFVRSKKFGGGRFRKFEKFWWNPLKFGWKNRNSVTFTDNSTAFTDNSIIFEKPFWPIKKIWVNLKFNKLNDIIFEKYLHRSA
jgi:hypothetical protein